MDFFFLFVFPIPYLALLAFTLTWCIRSMLGKAPSTGKAAWWFQLLFEFIFTVAGPAIGFMRFDAFGPEIPFSKEHVSAVVLVTIAASSSFWIAKISGRQLGTTAKWIVSGGMMAGILLCLVTTIHFGGYNLMGLMYPLFGFELLSPFMGIFILLKELWLLHTRVITEEIPGMDVLDAPVKQQEKVTAAGMSNALVTSVMIALPLLCVLVVLNFAMGHPLDALIRAYTESKGFIFSMHNF
jgi:hypothetical protein